MRTPSVHTTLDVANFGPIIEARIELRPLTVFVGPGNTGKSYLATLIYALHRHFNRRRREMRYWHPAKRPALRDALTEWMQAIGEGEESMAGGRIMLPEPLREEIRAILHERGTLFRGELCRCFGLNGTGSLIRKGSRQGARIALHRHATAESLLFEQEFTLAAKGSGDVRTVLADALSLPADRPASVGDDLRRTGYRRQVRPMQPAVVRESEVRYAFSRDLMEHLADSILPQILGALHAPAHYLPADRTGILRAYRVLLGSLIDRASQPDQSDSLPGLSGVAGDFLKQLVQFGDLSELRNQGMPRLAEGMEAKGMLAGSVDIETSPLGVPSFFYRPEGWKKALPLMQASSTVSELAPIVLYLRHVVQSGDVLIIDEPEAHLHPAMQAEFTRQIASFVHAGIRVVVTTHSEWVLEALANIVRRSKLSESRRKKMSPENITLHPDQVGVWLFKPKNNPGRCVVTESTLEESGLYPSGFDEVANLLHNDWADIAGQMEETD